jgi:hypothetical protein
MSLLAASMLLAYLAMVAACDVRAGRVPAWCLVLGAVGAIAMSVRPDGTDPRAAITGAATAFAVVAVPAIFGVVPRADAGVATIGGAWLGPGLALQALVIACAAAVVAAVAMVAARSPRLLLQFSDAFGPLTAPARAHVAIPCTLPLVAGFATTALLATRA